MTSYAMNTDKTEAATRREIAEQFRLWNPRYGDPIIETYDFPPPAKVGEATAMVRFILRGTPITVECSSQYGYADNLRCCFYAIQSMRMNEKRGIADTMKHAYLQLAAPAEHRDPYEVLGVRPEMDLEDIEAVYKRKAKRTHSDTGGDDEAMTELNLAIGRIRDDRNGAAP